jgi:hypothetical protein
VRTVVLSIRFFAWKFNEQGNEKLPRHGSTHSRDTDTPHGPSDPSCLILVMVRAHLLCVFCQDLLMMLSFVTDGRSTNTRIGTRGRLPSGQRPPPTILLAHASSWKKAETEDRFGASLFLFAEMVRLQRFVPVDWNKEDDRVAHWLICNLESVSIC